MELAEIQAEIAKNPTLKTGLVGALRDDVLTVLKNEGGIYRTKDEETQFLENHERNIISGKVDAEIGAKIKEVYDRLDKDIEESTGLKKGPHEKTYDFNKRVIAKLKADIAAKAGGDTTALQQQLQDAQKALEERKDYVPKTELEKLQTQLFTERIESRLTNALDKYVIAVPAHITDDKAKQQFIETQRRLIKSDFLSRFAPKQANGETVFYDGDKLLTNPATAKPLTEAELLSDHYAGYFQPVTKPKTGAGSGGSGAGDDVDPNESELKTKEEVGKYLEKKGLAIGSREFNKEYARIITDYGITK
jgi:hypothetical protein